MSESTRRHLVLLIALSVLVTAGATGCAASSGNHADSGDDNRLVVAAERGVLAPRAEEFCRSVWRTNASMIAAFDSNLEDVLDMAGSPGVASDFGDGLPTAPGTYLAVCIYESGPETIAGGAARYQAYWAGTDGSQGGMSLIAEW